MKKSILATVLALSTVLILTESVPAQEHETDWSLFSTALIEAIDSGNYGAKLGAIQQIAIYGTHLDVNRTVFDVVRVYRNSDSENEKILALSALAKMKNSWAMDFLSRSVRFEKSERVRHHTIDVVNAYRQGRAQSPDQLAWEAQLTPPSPKMVEELLAMK